ncbi:GNAT family N-acetyltransferase [Wenjunlia tyrosinilytica]|jgi:hypothetical protein|uniref:Twin-arginine translocation pathway signal protein n=1 Tax=Wenjunlia tyrosinilytica TaxID=1544741 RepID=A0A917ZLV9_9ACTN|nr:N-acetyltransferase [Wenjunlia tyrosinilytica]GGO86597.1 hypothetical protein GCM10012280_23100 [Wenjunlia tyrosinilytica]
MSANPFVPDGFTAPRELATDRFRLEPLGGQHNEADHAAWTSSIDHIRSTPGFESRDWPPAEGMPLERNLDDLVRHADDFERRTGFTYTVLEPGSGDVIGCLYIYPSRKKEGEVDVRSWVRADHAELDAPLYEAVSDWLVREWPFPADAVVYAGR